MAFARKNKDALREWREKCRRIFDSTEVNPFETEKEKEARIASLKRDYAQFVSYYLPHYATSRPPKFHIRAANGVRRNPYYKGWFQWGRGLAKSVVADVAIPLWLWMNNEARFMVVIGQNEDKAKILLGDLQAEFESNRRLVHDFGVQQSLGSWEAGFFKTEGGFIGKAIGMGQDPRGLRVGPQRPDLIVCDDWETRDIQKNPKRQDEYAKWLLRAVIPMMDGGNRRVILANNRFTPRMIFTVVTDGNPAWDIHRVDAYDPVTHEPVWPEKYGPGHYKGIEEEIGVLAAKAEYNNDPHIEGKVFTDDMIQWVRLPRIDHFDAICGFWDVAWAGTETSDYNAVRIWGAKGGDFYYIGGFCKQSKIRAAVEFMADYQSRLPASAHVHWRVEEQFHNDEILRTIAEVEKEKGVSLPISKSPKPRHRKYDRILSLHPLYQNGRIWYNEKMRQHNDTQQGLAQLKGIEPGYKGHDDAPDADQQAIEWLSRFGARRTAAYRIGRRESRKF